MNPKTSTLTSTLREIWVRTTTGYINVLRSRAES